MAKKIITPTKVESIRHKDKWANIPTEGKNKGDANLFGFSPTRRR